MSWKTPSTGLPETEPGSTHSRTHDAAWVALLRLKRFLAVIALFAAASGRISYEVAPVNQRSIVTSGK